MRIFSENNSQYLLWSPEYKYHLHDEINKKTVDNNIVIIKICTRICGPLFTSNFNQIRINIFKVGSNNKISLKKAITGYKSF